MAKQLNVNLAFSADTSKAKAQIRDLQAELTKLSTASTIGNFNNADMEKAIFAAKSLQMHLNNAVNVDTGKLDLSRFSKSLNSANQSLESLRNDLSLAGEQGNQAFLQLARSISQAEAPAIRISNTFREMGNTLKNTIRWQLSSSMLHGFMGAVQSAYGYAQDLDESLNNIRIVTGQSKEEMAEFAEQANKAAKALNTTTTAYTNAALIYYQQGDSDATVLEKTDVTAKMANVTGASAEEVSDQLTAIWNNFNQAGEESYERYADVLTALGAATASSTDEIAGGLEKFASIADMIGLSYDYAATALATITATTRQSEEVVGTALKTIFARIQGLSLGETLDDGTNLNKYSEALAKVGISIKDQNGELKDMDNILNEMGAKWQTLSKDQQVALAQTVAGVRQYNQLVSLMDNWDYFGENLAIAQGSEGALDAQAAIYAESWEAASKRVKAATEDVFDSLIDDDFFIALTNGTAEFVDGIGQVIDALGGMKGIITLISSIFLTNFSKEIPSTIQKLTENFNVLTGKAQQDAISMMEQNQRALEGFTSDNMTNALDAELTSLTKVNEMKTSLAKTSHLLTEAERQQFEQEIQMVEIAGQLVAKEGEKVDAIEKEIAANERRLISEAARSKQNLDGLGPRISNLNGDKEKADKIRANLVELKKLTQEYVACEQVNKRLDVANATWLTSGEVTAKSMIKNMTVFKQSFIEARGGVNELTEAEKQMCDTLEAEIKEANGDINKLKKAFENFGNGIKSSLNPVAFDLMDKKIADIEQALRDLGVNNEALNNLEQQFREGALTADEYRQKLLALANTESQSVIHATKMSETIGFIGAKMMQVSMAANTLKQAWNIWNDEDATLGEKILTTMTALGTIIPIVTAATNADNAAQTLNHGINLANLAVKSKLPIISALGAKASIALTAAKTGETAAVAGNTAAWAANPIGWIAFTIMGVIAAITALIAVLKLATEWIIKGNKIETENCETLIENAEKTKELADANEELSTSMENLIKQYEEMSKAGENTAETLVDIKAQIPELIKSYKELAESMGMPVDAIEDLQNAANLAILTGDFSDFNKQKEVLDSQLAIGTAKSAKSGSVAASTALAAKMQENQGRVAGSSYSVHVGGVDAGFNEEYEAVDILKREMGDYASKDISGDGIDLKVNNYADPLEMVDYYEKMVAARDAILKEMDQTQLQHSDTFREINELIAATASEYQTAKEQADEYIAVAGKAVEVEANKKLGMNMADADTMEEYLAYRKEFLKVAQDEYNMTEEQALAYLKQSEALGEMNNKYELAAMMAEKFGEGVEDFETDLSDSAKESYMTAFEELTKDLEGEDFALAIQVMADADSIKEFENEILRMGAKRETAIYEQMGSQLSAMMSESQENGGLTAEHVSSLEANEDFQKFLGENDVESMGEFNALNYDEQYAMLAEFHAKVQALRFDSAQYQKDLYYDDLATNQEVLDKMYAMTEEEEKKSLEMKQAYVNKQAELNKEGLSDSEKEKIEKELEDMEEQYEDEFGFAIDLDTTNIKNKMQEIEDQIKALDEQQIKVAIEWDGIKEIEGAFENVGDFASTMQKDAKKVSNSYQLTAAQAREWMEVYPDLFKQAEVTSDGLISLDQSVVDEYINGQNAEVDATVDAKINELEAEKTAMEAKLEMAEADLEAAAANAQGKAELEHTSAEYLANLREGLTQYYMDLGLDEVEANTAALETMGINEQEYTDLVAAAAEKNAQNQINASKDGGNAQASALSQLAQKWSKFTTLLKKVAVAVKAALTGEDVSEAWDSIDSTVSVDTSSYEGADLSGYKFDAANQEQIDAVREAVNLDLTAELEANKANIQKALDSIDSQITYLNAIKNQDIADYGSTNPDDVTGAKNLLEIAERYHEITREITAQEHALDKLSKEKDKAFGSDKLKFIDEEIKGYQNLYEEQNKLYLLRLADLALDQQNLQKTFNGKVDFNKDTNEINNFTDLYNSATEEQRKLLEEYEKSLDALRDQEDTLYDIASTLQSLNLEKITVEVESEVEINQRDLDKLDYIIDKLGRNLNTAIEQIDALGQQIGKYDSQSQSYRQGIEDIKATAAAEGRALTDEEQRKIWEYEDALLDINGALIDIVETVEAKILEEFDEFNSKIDDNINRFDTYNSMLDHYNNIIKLSGRQTKDSMLMMELSAQKTETSLQKLNVTRDKYLAQKSVQDDVASKLAEAQKSGNEADIKYWQEQYDEITKAVEESHDEMLASWEETLEAAGSQFELAIETTIQALKDSISEFGLDNLADRYSKGQEEQERYLSNLDKEYELNKLNREISGKIDDTDNIKAKQKLLELQDEINKKLASGEEMSRYDLEHLQKKYELELAKIALEEAQNAKSTVRLTKDSEGNFGYVYTADQDSIDNAQQNYEDKLYELKKSSEDYLDEMSEKIIQNQQEMMEALAEVDRTKFETQEEYEAELDRIKEYYMGRDKYYRGEMQKAMDELGITYQETLLGQLEGSASLEEAQSKLETNTNETVSKMGEAWKEWHDTVGNAMEEAGTSSETFTEDIKSDAEEIGTATEDLADVIDEQTENMVDYMGRLVEAVADWRDQYISAIDEIIKKNEELANVQAVSFDKDADYAALINEYLNNGGEVGDATYKELRKQRDAKIDWLEEQGYDSSYWGTRGSKTDEMYSRIAGGDGSAEENEWFTKDYIDDEKLVEIFNKLEVPLGALEQTVGNINTGTQEIKTATDTVGGKIDATQNYFNATSNAINTKNAEISGTIGDKLDANSQNALNQISTTEGSINQGISDAEKSLSETLSETVSGGKTLSDINDSISDAITAISADIDSAKKEIQEDIGSLSRQVNTLGTAAVGGAMGGPAGALIGGLVGGVISAAATMDTGGYTGNWGPEGKVAVLHEKELVLNKNDTSNLLNTLGVMKDIMHMIDVQANMASLSHLNAVSDIKSLNDTLEQNVTIHAEFPNATNRNEIEEAFSNLVNRATQYANRKK